MNIAVKDAGTRVSQLEQKLAEAVRERDAAVRAAVAGGDKMTEVARVAGISRQRVAQIMAAAA